MEGEKKLSHIAKVDEEKQYVFGWANVAIDLLLKCCEVVRTLMLKRWNYECSVCGEQWEGGTFNEDLSPAQDYKEVEEKDTELVQGIIVAVVYLILCAILGDDIWSRLGFIALNFLVTCIFSFAALIDEKSKHLAHLCGIGLVVQIVAGYYIVI